MERRFTEKQVAEVIRRATEIQAGASQTSSAGSITESNLRDAAREIGLDASVVAQAIAQIDREPQVRRKGFWGGPLAAHSEVAFQGTITEADWEEIVADIRKALGETGEISTRGSTFEWNSTGGGVATTTITVTQSNHVVKVTAHSRTNGLAFITHTLGGTAMLMSNAILLKQLVLPPMAELAIGVGVVGALFAATRAVVNRSSRNTASTISGIVQRIQSRYEMGDEEVMHGSAVIQEPGVQSDSVEDQR
ncbi:MAG: hypothetical protein KF812_01560 [Fimbriimonadaceae bacterium]|nr:hypothetical protein [Fimbriimonadaceae bacterium]